MLNFKKSIFRVLLLSLLAWQFFLMPSFAVEPIEGSQVFEANCAGCHINGGNIVRRGKNLKKQAMEKRGYTSVEAIADIVTNGKGIMSAYGDKLSSAEITAVSTYVLERSRQDWRS